MKKNYILTGLIVVTFFLNVCYSQGIPNPNTRGYIYAIKKNQTSSSFTEVHVLNRQNWFQSYSLHAITPIEQDWDNRFEYPVGDFNVWGTYYYSQPVWAIKKWGTGSGHTEIHILRPPNFDTYVANIVTSLPESDNTTSFLVGPYGDAFNWNNLTDLWVIKPLPTKTGGFSLKILSGESNFQTEIVDITIPVQAGTFKWQFSLGFAWNEGVSSGQHIPDLFMFKVWDNSIGTPLNLSFYRYDVANNVLAYHTTPHTIYGNNQVQVSAPIRYDDLGQIMSDVLVARKNGSGTNTTEAHILRALGSGGNLWGVYLMQTITALHSTYDNFDVRAGQFLGVLDDSINITKKNELVSNDFSSFNYPNPFNPVTKINYFLPKAGNLKITIFNSLGQSISVLKNELTSEGNHSINFDGSMLPSGIYYYKIESNEYSVTRKLMLLK